MKEQLNYIKQQLDIGIGMIEYAGEFSSKEYRNIVKTLQQLLDCKCSTCEHYHETPLHQRCYEGMFIIEPLRFSNEFKEDEMKCDQWTPKKK